MGDGRPRPRVALDAMGGDHAPSEIVGGALLASDDVEVILVGPEPELRAELAAAGADGKLEIVHAATAVGMEADPVLALRAKPDASIRVAAELVAAGRVDALVSAGSTGATLTAALLTLGRLPGVRRPVIAAAIPLRGGEVVLVDAGGSMDVHAEAFPGYALMGIAYAEIRGCEQPRVGLLNVGEEAGKGNNLAKAAYDELAAVPGFAGNVEPAAVLRGDIDVVVTDGFTGNVFLKTVETLLAHGAATAGAAGHGDGAALVLGVAGEVLVAHGAARAHEVAAAVRTAGDVAAAGLSRRLGALLAPSGAVVEGAPA